MEKAGPVVLFILAVCLIPSAYVGVNELSALKRAEAKVEAFDLAAKNALEAGDTVAAIVALRQAKAMRPADERIEQRLLIAESRLSIESPASVTEAGAVSLLVRLKVAGLDADSDPYVAIALGQLRLFRGENEAAHEAFVKAAERHPKAAHAHAALGRSFLIRQDAKQASAAFERAVSLAPKVAAYREGLGRTLTRLAKWGSAVEAFTQATELTDSPMARLQLGEAQLKLGNHDASIKSLRFALKRLTNQGSIARARAALGFAYHQAGKLSEAAVELEAAAALRSDGAVYFNLGTVRHALGQHRLAMLAFQTGLQYEPGNAGAHLQLIRSLVALGQKKAALKIRKRLIRIGGSRPEVDGLVKTANALLGIP